MADDEADGPAGAERWLGTAAARFLVMTREADYHERYQKDDKLRDGEEIEWPVPFWHVDAGDALMLILLAAIDEGLAAGVYGIAGALGAKYRALFAIPEDLAFVAGVTVGRPLPDPVWSGLTSRATQERRTLDELVRWNAWRS